MTARGVFPCSIEQSADGTRMLVATRNIEQGELVLVDKPVISAPDSLAPSYRAWAIVFQLLKQREPLSWFLSLGFQLTLQAWDEEDEALSSKFARDFGTMPSAVRDLYFRVATNHVGFFDPRGQFAGSGLFETFCFSNHSCAPNSMPTAVKVSFEHAALLAIEHIRAGDELTWNYSWPSHLGNSREGRQATLRSKFGFDCRCRLCNQEQEHDRPLSAGGE